MVALTRFLVASAGVLVSGRFLIPKNATTATQKSIAHAAKAHNKTDDVTPEQQLASLEHGLQSIQNLKSMFTAGDAKSAVGASAMASGAMTMELSNKDSEIWKAISTMIDASKAVSSKMKSAKGKDDREKIMNDLEGQLNGKAEALKVMTDKANKVNEQHSAEYLLGLLNQHSGSWSIEQQLNVTLQFANGSRPAWKLAHQHDMSKPFAPQLAVIMDEESRRSANTTTKAKKANAVSATAKKAAKQFVQLVDSLRILRGAPKMEIVGKPTGYRNAWDDCGGAGASATMRMQTIAAKIKGWSKPRKFIRNAAQDAGAVDPSGTKPGPAAALVYPAAGTWTAAREGLATAKDTLAKYK